MTQRTIDELDWDAVEQLVTNITWDIRKQITKHGLKLDGIIGIARGGLVPAVMLSHRFGLRNLHVVRATQYDDTHAKGDLAVTLDGSLSLDYSARYLLVDDIADTGDTLRFFRKLFPNSLTAVLVANDGPIRDNLVDFMGCGNPSGNWTTFPWEVK